MNTHLQYKNQLKFGFSKRLIQLLHERGKTAPHSRYGVSAEALAHIAGCSLTMARHYLNGKSIPENDVLNKIADWGKVKPSWLLYGDAPKPLKQNLDRKLWVEIFSYLRSHIIENRLNKEAYMKIINFAVDIYDNVSVLDISEEEKIKLITMMAKSIEISANKKS